MNAPTYITGFTQATAQRILREHVVAVLDCYGLTPSAWAMLGLIVQAKDGTRQVEIARSLHVKAPLVTAMAQQLQHRGLVQIVPNHLDARTKLLAVTPKGKKFMRTVEATLQQKLQKLLHGLSQDDLTNYNRVLTTIIANDDALSKEYTNEQ